MLEIQLDNIGKRFQYEWIFKKLTFTIPAKEKLAVTGSNGSGKSTLLKCIAGQIPVSDGKIVFLSNRQPVQDADVYKYISISAPYLELPEEFTLLEFLRFHFKFKKLAPGISIKDATDIMYLQGSLHKPIMNFSSGMKQRLKLGICFLSDTPLLILDEPTSNLDENGVKWYLGLVNTYGQEKSLLVGSNDPREFSFCDKTLHIENFK